MAARQLMGLGGASCLVPANPSSGGMGSWFDSGLIRSLGSLAGNGKYPSAADDQSEEKPSAESAKDTFRWVLADVVLGGEVELLGFHAGVLPLL